MTRSKTLEFLIFLGVTLGLPLLGCAPQVPLLGLNAIRSENRLSIMQGPTSADQTILSVVVPRKSRYKFILLDPLPGRVFHPSKQEFHTRPFSQWGVKTLHYRGLTPKRVYQFKVLDAQKNIVDFRTLRSLNYEGKKSRFIIASCMDDTWEKEQREIWPEAMSLRPDFLIFLGDNVYTDKETKYSGPVGATTIWRRYVETRRQLEIYKTPELTPIFATWDDHDYGLNDGDRHFKFRNEAIETFKTFFPQQTLSRNYRVGPGVSSFLEAFGQRFFLMDSRSFRTKNNKSGKNETHWGKNQENWLFELMGRSKKPTWIMNGNQFFGVYHPFESYQRNHPRSFEKFLRRLRKTGVVTVFGSGDQHLIEVMKIPKQYLGFPTYEFTSSAIHAKTFPQSRYGKNPLQIAGTADVMNYLLIESHAKAQDKLEVRAIGYGPAKEVLFDIEVEVSNHLK